MSSAEEAVRLQRQVAELQRKNSELTLASDNLNAVVKKLKTDKIDLETKNRNLEELAENHGRDKEQLDKLNKSIKDLKVRTVDHVTLLLRLFSLPALPLCTLVSPLLFTFSVIFPLLSSLCFTPLPFIIARFPPFS